VWTRPRARAHINVLTTVTTSREQYDPIARAGLVFCQEATSRARQCVRLFATYLRRNARRQIFFIIINPVWRPRNSTFSIPDDCTLSRRTCISHDVPITAVGGGFIASFPVDLKRSETTTTKNGRTR